MKPLLTAFLLLLPQPAGLAAIKANDQRQFYGLDRLCQVAVAQRSRSAAEICAAIVADVRQHIRGHRVYNDLTLLVLKQR